MERASQSADVGPALVCYPRIFLSGSRYSGFTLIRRLQLQTRLFPISLVRTERQTDTNP